MKGEHLKRFYLYIYLDGFNKVVTAGLLIFSLIKFRRQAKAMDLAEYFVGEKLIALHLVIFIVYILAYFAACISFFMIINAADGLDFKRECRAVASEQIISVVGNSMNIALTILFIYLSVKFSAPLSDYQEKFLLIFQTSHLDRVESATIEYKKARKYNKAAMRHQQLIIWRAFTNEESFYRESEACLEDLNTEEALLQV